MILPIKDLSLLPAVKERSSPLPQPAASLQLRRPER